MVHLTLKTFFEKLSSNFYILGQLFKCLIFGLIGLNENWLYFYAIYLDLIRKNFGSSKLFTKYSSFDKQNAKFI